MICPNCKSDDLEIKCIDAGHLGDTDRAWCPECDYEVYEGSIDFELIMAFQGGES